ncbi:hypothetical protein GCM10023074_45370 [Microbispora amethystogenes]|uniref:Uncharacterized protein n=1 Tax=Microbispora amethystogenes TaxID=1427754 RepID=A0ABQ4FJ39_9ACTN|nr:hypothetical protein Mam01_49710 [Microbispora amethystogenes]
MPRPALLRVLIQERHWDNWAVFCNRFKEAARVLAHGTGTPQLARTAECGR